MKKPLEELECLVCLEPQVDHHKDNHRINFTNNKDNNNNNDNTSINSNNKDNNNNGNNNINLGHSSSRPLILAKEVFVKNVLKREFFSRLNKIRSTGKVEQNFSTQNLDPSLFLSSSVLSENESICVKRRKKNPFLLSFETKERQKFRIKMSQKVNS